MFPREGSAVIALDIQSSQIRWFGAGKRDGLGSRKIRAKRLRPCNSMDARCQVTRNYFESRAPAGGEL
jgi:hypothetical protein